MNNEILTFSHFSQFCKLNHGIFTRNGGHSKNNFSSLNLSYLTGDFHNHVSQNRMLVSNHFQVGSLGLLFPNQSHSSTIQVVTKSNIQNNSLFDNTDALICGEKDIVIGILTADCVPILFYDRGKRVVAAAHAGWRGTVLQIGPTVIHKMLEYFHSKITDIYVGIGPAISKKNYEVGPEVVQQIVRVTNNTEQFLSPSKKEGHAYLDLPLLNFKLLEKEGIPSENIEMLNYCTFGNPDLFFSARRDGFQTGRFGTVIKNCI
jgi:polyphenol oxidase